VNVEFVRIFGYTPAEIVDGISLSFIVPPHLHHEAIDSRKRLSQGESVSIDTVRMRKDGSLVHVSQIAVPVSMDGEQISYYYLFRDITQSKKAAEALQQAHAELVHLSRVTTIGELVASIAHEVNQPITAVVTNGNAASRWLSQQPPNLEEVKTSLNNIVRDAVRAAEVIGRIRSLVQKSTPQMEPLSICEVIEGVLNLLDSEIRRGGVRVETELGNLPLVVGDRIQLQQVMLNLILNSIEAMAEVPEVTRKLHIDASVDGDNIVVQVQDAGMGIGERDEDQIFNPFFSTKTEGLGMGLAISRSIIESHGGRLWATPIEHGALLSFTLPTSGH
jgi:PAS domain S-box-containing protein